MLLEFETAVCSLFKVVVIIMHLISCCTIICTQFKSTGSGHLFMLEHYLLVQNQALIFLPKMRQKAPKTKQDVKKRQEVPKSAKAPKSARRRHKASRNNKRCQDALKRQKAPRMAKKCKKGRQKRRGVPKSAED